MVVLSAQMMSRTAVRWRVRGRVQGVGFRWFTRNTARELGVADAVAFHGFVSREELSRRFAESDCFVLPAVVDAKGDVEGLGVALIEALRYGTPVIASAATSGGTVLR